MQVRQGQVWSPEGSLSQATAAASVVWLVSWFSGEGCVPEGERTVGSEAAARRLTVELLRRRNVARVCRRELSDLEAARRKRKGSR